MKQSFLILFLVTFQIATCQTNKENDTKKISKNGYEFFYNSDLILDESGRNGTEFCLLTQKADSEDNFIENINLIIHNLENLSLDLNKLVELTESQIKNNGEIIESKRIKTTENEFHLFISEGTFNGLELKFLQYDFVKNNKAYILTYSAKKDQFDKYLTEMETIMKSFKIQ